MRAQNKAGILQMKDMRKERKAEFKNLAEWKRLKWRRIKQRSNGHRKDKHQKFRPLAIIEAAAEEHGGLVCDSSLKVNNVLCLACRRSELLEGAAELLAKQTVLGDLSWSKHLFLQWNIFWWDDEGLLRNQSFSFLSFCWKVCLEIHDLTLPEAWKQWKRAKNRNFQFSHFFNKNLKHTKENLAERKAFLIISAWNLALENRGPQQEGHRHSSDSQENCISAHSILSHLSARTSLTVMSACVDPQRNPPPTFQCSRRPLSSRNATS